MPRLTSDSNPLSPYRVIWDLMNIADVANTIITHDAGSPRDELSPFWKSTTPLSYIGWGKSTQLGYGLGLAMGAKLAHPENSANFWGDAAIGMTGMDFETCVRCNIPILSILFNNFSMAMEFGDGLSKKFNYRHLRQPRVRQGAGRLQRTGRSDANRARSPTVSGDPGGQGRPA
jgi:thiamine pyrophosphate-dependent acetolactate synthase large subunit-like protein